MIPQVIHQIWIQGYDKIPESLMTMHKNCKNINNNFKYELWDEEKIRKLLEEHFEKKYIELYDGYTVFAQKADFARYAILYIHGGVYMDMDITCKKNIESFLKHQMFFTTYRYPKFFKRYLNGIIGSKPKHPIFEIVFKNIFIRKNMGKSITNSTGTGLFYDSVTEYSSDHPNSNDYTIIDYRYLDPCHAFSGENCINECTDCYVVHTSYSSWSPLIKFGKMLVKHKFLILGIIIIIILLILSRFNKS